jgi:1-acyl-sn-glycerol-3-phosphate acyltransferase
MLKSTGSWLFNTVVIPIYVGVMERILGWQVDGYTITERKLILLTEPHTSNFDIMVVFYWACKIRRRVHFVIKKETQNWFLIGRFLTWAGAIYIDRDAPLSALKTILRELRAKDDFILLIAPSGTRKYTDGWKPGFYYIAQKANVPIIAAGADFARKRAIIATPLYPTGDIHADIERMRPFLEQITAKHPERVAPIRLLAEKQENVPI